MANEKFLNILRQGVEVWNKWRNEYPDIRPDLDQIDLSNADLPGINLSNVNLSDAYLIGSNLPNANFMGALLVNTYLVGADLTGADLSFTDLRGAHLREGFFYEAVFRCADLSRADLSCANFTGAEFPRAELTETDFTDADLTGVDFRAANFHRTYLSGAKINLARFLSTTFKDMDFRGVHGLENVIHSRPSEVSISTLYRSEGQIPEIFLLGCGVPDALVVQVPALSVATQPIQFYSCFISYSGKDEDFAGRLHSKMREAKLRVWFAPEDIKGGDKIYDQIDRAIQVHDRLLLVLSENSLRSKWVGTEIRRARKVEMKEGRRKLFPIRLTTYEALQGWVCIDSSTGEDLAEEVRGYFIPDFSNWKSHEDFERAFARLYEDRRCKCSGIMSALTAQRLCPHTPRYEDTDLEQQASP